MAGNYEQFIAFGVDNAGLERLLRLFQSFFQVLTSYPLLIASVLPTYPVSVHVSTETLLRQLQGRLNITRRWLRLFRFLEAFQAGWGLYLSENKAIETWLDAHSKTCLGMFGLLESVTLPDLLGVDHLEIFGSERTVSLNVDAQRFWFVALYLSAMSSGIKLVRILASPVPQTEDGSVQESSSERDAAKTLAKSGEKKATKEDEGNDLKKVWMKKVSEQTAALGLKLVSDVLDLVIPASIVGWVQVDTGLVGIAMFCSTVITGTDVWKRCGRQLESRRV